MNSKQRKTLEAIFSYPTYRDILWEELEALLLAIGAEKKEGSGSRVKFRLANGVELFMHRPHNPNVLKGHYIRAARQFIEKVGVMP